MEIQSSRKSSRRLSLPILTSSLSDSSDAHHSIYQIFLSMNEFGRTDNPWSLLCRHVYTVAYYILIYQRRQDDDSTYMRINARISAYLHVQAQKCPIRGKPKRPFSHWPFSELTILTIDRHEFWHKMPEFTSSGRQLRICFRTDTWGFLLLYGRLPPTQCRALRYITRTL